MSLKTRFETKKPLPTLLSFSSTAKRQVSRARVGAHTRLIFIKASANYSLSLKLYFKMNLAGGSSSSLCDRLERTDYGEQGTLSGQTDTTEDSYPIPKRLRPVSPEGYNPVPKTLRQSVHPVCIFIYSNLEKQSKLENHSILPYPALKAAVMPKLILSYMEMKRYTPQRESDISNQAVWISNFFNPLPRISVPSR